MQITLWCASITHGAESKGFEKWLEDFRNQAVRQGISKATIETTLSKTKYLPEVMERYRNQPEFKLSLDEYLSRVVPERRVQLEGKNWVSIAQFLMRCISESRWNLSFL